MYLVVSCRLINVNSAYILSIFIYSLKMPMYLRQMRTNQYSQLLKVFIHKAITLVSSTFLTEIR